MVNSRDEIVFIKAEAQDHYRLQLLGEAVEALKQHAARYRSEPSPAAWADFVRALTAVTGDGDAYAVLEAIQIHGNIARYSSR